jgi:glutamate 5-kinase
VRLVIKIGSSLLGTPDGGLAQGRMRGWAKEIAQLRRAGHEVILVSSGAIRAGMQALRLKKRPLGGGEGAAGEGRRRGGEGEGEDAARGDARARVSAAALA